MLADMLQKSAEAAGQPKADRQTRGIGGQAQHVELYVWIQTGPVVTKLPAARQTCQRFVYSFAVDRLLVGAGWIEQLRKEGLGRRIPFRPESDDGVADHQALPRAWQQQVVESGPIGEGGMLGDRGVATLLVPVGGEGVQVEGNQGSAAALGAGHTLDRRM